MARNPIVFVCVVVCCCGCPLGTPRDHSRPIGHQDTRIALSPTGDDVLFNAAGEGGRDLYLLELATKKVTRLTDTSAYETAASFSPDGQRIVFSAGLPGDRADHLFVMNRDGTSRVQLTDVDANDTSARFSPDGKRIVFARDKTYIWGGLAANWEPGGVICLIDADGGNFRQLTPDGEYAYEPYFSADGSEIIYSSVDGGRAILVDGSSPSRFLQCPAGIAPSPDGKLVAYSKGKYSPDCKIYVANQDGTDERCLTPELGYCFYPDFARERDQVWFLRHTWPDGFSSEPKGSIWKVGIDGKGLVEVTDIFLFDDPLKWEPGK